MPRKPEPNSEPAEKTSISLLQSILKRARERQKALGFTSFSAYVQSLVIKDLESGAKPGDDIDQRLRRIESVIDRFEFSGLDRLNDAPNSDQQFIDANQRPRLRDNPLADRLDAQGAQMEEELTRAKPRPRRKKKDA